MALIAPSLRRQRWLWLHATLAGLIIASSVALVAPAGRQALEGAEALSRGGAADPWLAAALRVERVAGAINILLAIALVAIGVIKPSLRVGALKRGRRREVSGAA